MSEMVARRTTAVMAPTLELLPMANEKVSPETELSYEQARDELAEVVRKLESGGLSLDDAVALWERGEALARRCEEQLAGARERVQKVLDAAEGVAGR